MKYDLIVVGGRVAGSISSFYASKYGLKVLMIEKNPEIGVPVQCAGAVSDTFFKSMKIKPSSRFTCSKITGACIHAPSGASFLTRDPLITGYIVERKIFDKHLAIMAAEQGTDIMLNTIAKNLIIKDGRVTGVTVKKDGQIFDIHSDIVIAADGIQSKIARKAGLDTRFKADEICSCAQSEMVGVNIKKETMEFYLGNRTAPGGYLWIFPKGDERANIGVGIRRNEWNKKSAHYYLKKFTSKLDATEIEFNIGAVPLGGPIKKTYADGLLVVGDAAGQVDPLTGGGIHTAAECAKIASETVVEAIEKGRTDAKFLKEYEKRWYKKIGVNIERSLKYRKILDKLTDKDLNNLVESLKGKELNLTSKLSLLKLVKNYPDILKILKEIL
ncbi:MAG TPA: NAD(P)/FAD-dependent oxidoreductase [Methanothermobacter sp.]|nr:digeranylgeranylglycerophospholipid reductase [Methanothermobacter sp. MT-2]HHW04492.1 NAD(P)/FAD-dependent oxidoreductase [Methanothermobacter sp.]HOK73054.1 NAD(P)/FAD-dependent oxidoreductase [Methanothermobacter sp.]HOL69599.1 NAD(P)/FAD-dependent oxidoreductase [Methanothermobacter sp.]HPQ04578.1 NAD(P)/FAD-dependent oxidoreductase [Methanothermobacter sp.]